MKFILDTDTLIYWTNGQPKAVENIALHGKRSLAASVISKAELFYGAYRSQHVDENIKVIKKLAKTIKFLPVDDKAQQLFGQIKAELQKKGKLIEDADLLIAATALAAGKTLVTNNQKHFQRIAGLKTDNWIK